MTVCIAVLRVDGDREGLDDLTAQGFQAVRPFVRNAGLFLDLAAQLILIIKLQQGDTASE